METFKKYLEETGEMGRVVGQNHYLAYISGLPTLKLGEMVMTEKEEASILEKELRALPEMKLDIAFFPTDNFLNRISQWLQKEFDQRIILDITVNPKVVAGAIIEYQGNWRDFSLAKKIDQLFGGKLTSSWVSEVKQ